MKSRLAPLVVWVAREGDETAGRILEEPHSRRWRNRLRKP
jgi:hypothetical protein